MCYTFRLYDSIRQVPQDAWIGLRRDQHDLYMDPRFISIVEETMRQEGRFWSLLIYDDGGRPAACASLCLYPLDVALLCPPRGRRIMRAVRRVWPRCLIMPILFCGLPVSAGQSPLRMATDADPRQVMRQLDRALTGLATEAKSTAIVCKEFTDADLPHVDSLCELGYIRGPSLPMNYFAPRFRDFEHFCSALRSHYRYKIHRSRHKFAQSGLRVAHFCGAEAAVYYTDETHRLYLAVLERADVVFEILPAEFFRQLATRFGDAVHMTAIFQGSRIVAFSWGLLLGDSYQNMFIGVDYRISSEFDLYFNLMASDLDHALKLGVAEIQMGQTADVFKSRLGCQGQARHVYAKGTRWFTAMPLRRLHSRLMPPPPPPPARDLFREG